MRATVGVAGVVSVFLVAGCGRGGDAALAARGQVDGRAPVRADESIVVAASPARVWRVLADIRNWPAWQHDVSRTWVRGEPGTGVRFGWSIPGGMIHARIMLFEPGRRIAWAGRLFVFHAVHVWTLLARPDGGTTVRTTESMTGWPIGLVYSSDALAQADRRWLGDLKRAVGG